MKILRHGMFPYGKPNRPTSEGEYFVIAKSVVVFLLWGGESTYTLHQSHVQSGKSQLLLVTSSCDSTIKMHTTKMFDMQQPLGMSHDQWSLVSESMWKELIQDAVQHMSETDISSRPTLSEESIQTISTIIYYAFATQEAEHGQDN